jgi:hypothetical protein
MEQSIERDYPRVERVNILEFDGWGRAGQLKMQIFFHDNNWLFLRSVHCDEILDMEKPENITIAGCNNYQIISYSQIGPAKYETILDIFLDDISKEIDVSLSTLNDVIENYLVICKYFNDLDDLPCNDLDDVSKGQFLEIGHNNWKWKNNVVRFRMPLHESHLIDTVTF